MLMKTLFEQALNITDPWYIKDINFDSEQKRLDIYIDFRRGALFHYENQEENIAGDYKAYDTLNKQWRHLNFFEHECYLNARVPRVEIDDQKKRLIKTPWEGMGNGFTLLFEVIILQLSINMPVLKVANLFGVSDDKIWRILEKYGAAALAERNLEDVDSVGIDETSAKKGHNYITLFVDMKKRKTIFITEGKDSNTIKDFKEDLEQHNGNIDSIKDVSCDMSKAFIKGIKEQMKNAEITFDKFHIMKIINKAVNEVRKSEVKIESLLLKTKYIFLKNRENLTPKEKEKFKNILISKLNIKTLRAYHIRENFQAIYKAETRDEFIALLKKWYFWATHSRLEPIKKAAYTIRNHWDGVIRWKESQLNNGILEGLNSIIQSAKSKARGYKTIKNLKIMAYLLTAKFDFRSINKFYLPI